MTYETQKITFNVIHMKVSSDSRCSRTLSMNVAIDNAHCGCERNSCMVKYDKRHNIVSMYVTQTLELV